MSDTKKGKYKNNVKAEVDDQPKPRKEYSYQLANEHKAWIMKQQEHNDWKFTIYPTGEDFSKETSEDAYGIWTTTYQKPLIFGHPEFQLDFEQNIGEDIFKFRVGEWDLTCSGPAKRRWTDGHGKAWEFLLSTKSIKKTRDYGSADIFKEANEMIIGEKA